MISSLRMSNEAGTLKAIIQNAKQENLDLEMLQKERTLNSEGPSRINKRFNQAKREGTTSPVSQSVTI